MLFTAWGRPKRSGRSCVQIWPQRGLFVKSTLQARCPAYVGETAGVGAPGLRQLLGELERKAKFGKRVSLGLLSSGKSQESQGSFDPVEHIAFCA